MPKNKPKKQKKLTHVTYNQKSFLAPNSILSMAAVHAKIKPDGTAILRISDCNNCVRIWNDFNTPEGKIEMVEKLDMLISQIQHFRSEVLSRCPTGILPDEKVHEPEFEKIN